MGADEDSSLSQTEPLAKTRTRRSNAGARMHEMMFNAEDDEALAQAYGIIKAEDESSDDEEYVPKDLEDDRDHADDGDDNDDTDDDSSTSDSDDESVDDEDDEADGDEEDDETEADATTSTRKIKQELTDEKTRIKSESKLNSNVQPGSPTKQAYDACSRICSVCLGDQSDDDDEIIECDSCGVTVHERCYGVSCEDDLVQDDDTSVHSMISSESTEPWFCEPCQRSVRNPHCELCPNLGGIFKETDTGRWVHLVCALYTRGVTFNNTVNLTGVSLFELNYGLYGSKACTICEDRGLARSGICIGCDAGLCKTFFHPTCAQKEGLLFELPSDEVDPFFAQCKQHADKSIIRRKKKTCMVLFARLKRVQGSEIRSERVKRKLAEMNQQPDPCLSKWTPDNQPPIPKRVGRMLLTSPAVILKLTRKSELLGLDPKSAFMTIQDEMEMARQKWHIPPSFNLEFVAYCRDRTTRMIAMNKRNGELMSQNSTLKKEETNLRQRYNSLKDNASSVRAEIDDTIKQIRNMQSALACVTGDSTNLPHHLESLIEKFKDTKSKSPTKNSRTTTKTSTTYKCHKCDAVKDQHLLALCDTCHCYFHIYCLDPPLSRVPKKTKFGGWQCSDCSEKNEEEQEEALEEEQTNAIEEANKPRRLRERVNAPDKYCQESMQLADFWSLSKKRSKKSGSKSSNLKKPKLGVKIEE